MRALAKQDLMWCVQKVLDDGNKVKGLAYRHAGIWIETAEYLLLGCGMETRGLTKLADSEHETVLRDRHDGRR